MTWYLGLYIVSTIVFSIGAGFTFTRKETAHRYEEDFNSGAFFMALAICSIAGLFLFKYNIL